MVHDFNIPRIAIGPTPADALRWGLERIVTGVRRHHDNQFRECYTNFQLPRCHERARYDLEQR
jgi:hypothetical protein